MTDCMWRDRYVVRFDGDGVLEIYWTMTNVWNEYCGRDVVFLRGWERELS